MLYVSGSPKGTINGNHYENDNGVNLNNVSNISVDHDGSDAQHNFFKPSDCCYTFSKRVLQWLIDSGATINVVDDISCLSRITSRDCNQSLRVANGQSCKVVAIGEVDLVLRGEQNGSVERTITLKNVHVAPGIDTCVISTRRLWKDNRIRTKFGRFNTLKTLDGFKYYFHDAPNGHYYAQPESEHSLQAISNDIIHARLGHCGEKRARMAASRTTGLDLRNYKHPKACDPCLQGGNKIPLYNSRQGSQDPQKQKHFGESISVTAIQAFGSKVNSDLYGPLPKSIDGNFKYAICFVDKATRTADVAFLKSKSSVEVLAALKSFQSKYRDILPNGRVSEWRCDNGGEFMSSDLDDFCEELAIKRSWSVPYEPRGNARAERFWGIVAKPMRKMLAQSKLPLQFWTFAMLHATHLHDVLPTRGLPDGMSPFEARTGIKPDISGLRVFGCKAFVYVQRRDRSSKLAPTFVECVHLGCDPERPGGYYVYIPSLNRITTSMQIRFRENQFIQNLRVGRNATVVRQEPRDATGAPFRADEGPERQEPNAQPNVPANAQQNAYNHGDDTHWAEDHCEHPDCTKGKHPSHEPHSFEETTERQDARPSGRTRSNVQMLRTGIHRNDAIAYDIESKCAIYSACGPSAKKRGSTMPYLFNVEAVGSVPEPRSFAEAMASALHYKWEQAMDKEIADLLAHDTWELVRRDSLPKGRKPAKSKWVYKVKYLRDGTVERLKARFVVCGYSQVQGFDYDKAFSSTLRATSFRTLLAIAAIHGLCLRQCDVTNAFTQAKIDADVYVDQAKGYEVLDEDGTPLVLKLKRALYGTKQASRLWQDTLRAFLCELGFKNSLVDPCLYSMHDKRGTIILGVYVDDIIVGTSNDAMFNWFWQKFERKFRSKCLGKLEWFLGVAVDQSSNGDIEIHQSKYISDLVDKFLPDIKSLNILRDTPALADRFGKLGKAESDEERERMRSKPYMQLIGSLLYLSTMCRPDIAYHLSVLCRFMGNPSEECFNQALHVLVYLHKTKHLKIRYSRNFHIPGTFWEVRDNIGSNMGFHTLSDSSWGVPNPTYGHVTFMAGGPISWIAKNLKSADSSCEAEYSAVSKAARDITFIRHVCEDLGYMLKDALPIGVDNTAAIDVAYNLGVTARNKHYDREMHYIREQVAHAKNKLLHVRTEFQTADIFTKCLEKVAFIRHRETLFV